MNDVIQQPPSTVPSPSRRERVEMYAGAHKGLRYMLAQLLISMGQTNWDEPANVDVVLNDLALALRACDEHILHEDEHVRPALIERGIAAVATLDAEHSEHAQQVAELKALMASLQNTTNVDARMTLGTTLYLHYSVFVAETLAHMAYEERVIQPLLERTFSVSELKAINFAIVSSIQPADMMMFLTVMVPATNRAARAELVGNVKSNAPPPVLDALLDSLRPRLTAEDMADLERRLSPVT